MIPLAIVSRDYSRYQQAFLASTYTDKVELIHAASQANDKVHKYAEIILSEPDIAASFLPFCKSLKWLQSTWAGNNKLQRVKKRDYVLTGTKGIFGAQMREYTMAYILYFERDIPFFLNTQSKRQWKQKSPSTLVGKTLGIMGLGSIGIELAKAAKAFGMSLAAITNTQTPLADVDYFRLSERNEFADCCDFIVNLLPETEATKGICDEVFFKAMRANAIFINAGRGTVLKDEQVLVNALDSKQLSAAVLDVFKEEPLPPDSMLYQHANIFITNHTAAMSNPEGVFDVFKTNLDRYIRATSVPTNDANAVKEKLLYVHDFTRGY
uniref:D-2-hydroxyacid dehydrogenase n=1 Tax=Ningiella ruwaisensis TaxID=2364274 RepID=UPI00109F14FB|nr:D-2-hydroxyacid dehydrogenase [Ningiella ruwaisensis]